MMRRAILTLAMVCALALPAHADDSPEADAKATPTGIHQVWSGGFWTDGKVDGHYRIVVVAGGFEHVSHRLFIQWIAIDPDEHDLKLIRTVSVGEVNDLSGVITDLKPQFRPNTPLKFTVTLEGRDGKKLRRTVTATANGKYTIR
jgi:hypothetical protein